MPTKEELEKAKKEETKQIETPMTPGLKAYVTQGAAGEHVQLECERTVEVNGQFLTTPGVYIQFQNGYYVTADQKEIKLIESTRQFEKGLWKEIKPSDVIVAVGGKPRGARYSGAVTSATRKGLAKEDE